MQQPADQPHRNPPHHIQPTQVWNAGSRRYLQQKRPPVAHVPSRHPSRPGGLRQSFESKLGIGYLIAVLLFSCCICGLVTAVGGDKTATTIPSEISIKSSLPELPSAIKPTSAAPSATKQPALTPAATPNPT